jgi:uroporphyrinogen-III synthase
VAALGAFVVHENVLAVEDLDGAELPARLASLRAGDAVCLTSANAARRLAGLAPPQGVRLAAVGTSTARALAGAGLAADLVGNGGGRELAATLALARGARVLYPCAEHTHGELEQELARGGIEVERLVLYRTRAELGAALQGEVDCRLYLSPSAVAAALAWERAHAPAARRVALGAATSAALAAAGLPHRPAASTAPDDVLAALVGLETPNPTNPPRP